MLKGYSVPLSPLGQANLAPRPPWHYSSDVVAAEFWVDRDAALEVLARLTVDAGAPPHPVFAGGAQFDAVLQSRAEAGLGRLVVCDATLWTSTNGGLRGLQAFWKNVLEA